MTNHTRPDLWETLISLTGGDVSLAEAHDTILAMINQADGITRIYVKKDKREVLGKNGNLTIVKKTDMYGNEHITIE